jgi:hypothetical protein
VSQRDKAWSDLGTELAFWLGGLWVGMGVVLFHANWLDVVGGIAFGAMISVVKCEYRLRHRRGQSRDF